MTKSKFSSINSILVYFKSDHLPNHLKQISAPFSDLANQLAQLANDANIAEVMAGLRKLLESKDCAVRAALSC